MVHINYLLEQSLFPKKMKNQNVQKTIIYARVSSNEQRQTNLVTQAERLVDFCMAKGCVIDDVVKEVGSGLNDNRNN